MPNEELIHFIINAESIEIARQFIMDDPYFLDFIEQGYKNVKEVLLILP